MMTIERGSTVEQLSPKLVRYLGVNNMLSFYLRKPILYLLYIIVPVAASVEFRLYIIIVFIPEYWL